MFSNGLLCIALPKETIKGFFRIKPEKLLINIEESFVQDVNNKYSFTLSDYQKELIKNSGSVGVMIKLAAEIQYKNEKN